jgi:hypothetical protein
MKVSIMTQRKKNNKINSKEIGKRCATMRNMASSSKSGLFPNIAELTALQAGSDRASRREAAT